MLVTFVTGVSCAGKTTVARALHVLGPEDRRCATLHVEDIDGPGTPDAGHLDWLRWRAAQLLYEAVTVEPEDRHTVICGIVWPHHVIDSSAWELVEGSPTRVRFLLLDTPWPLVKERLNERNAEKPKSARRALRDYNRHLAGVLRRQVEQQRSGHVYRHAGEHTPEQIARFVARKAW